MCIISCDTFLFPFQLCVSDLTAITKETESCWWLFPSPGLREAPAWGRCSSPGQGQARGAALGSLWLWSPPVLSAVTGDSQHLQPGAEGGRAGIPRSLPGQVTCTAPGGVQQTGPSPGCCLWGLPLHRAQGRRANPAATKTTGKLQQGHKLGFGSGICTNRSPQIG